MENELCSFSSLIVQPYCLFTYVTAPSPTLLWLHKGHSSFSNPSFASRTSQALHLLHLASRPCIKPQVGKTCDSNTVNRTQPPQQACKRKQLEHWCANHDTEGKRFKFPIHCYDGTKPPYLISGELCNSPLHCLCTQCAVGAPVSASLCSEHVNQTSY